MKNGNFMPFYMTIFTLCILKLPNNSKGHTGDYLFINFKRTSFLKVNYYIHNEMPFYFNQMGKI